MLRRRVSSPAPEVYAVPVDRPGSSESPFEGVEMSPLAMESRTSDLRRGEGYGAGAIVSAVLGLLMLGAVVVGVTLRILGLG
ncbi:MAG: hypothetical protein C0506_11120 [Anaerolinea sp.]|nr:hypothetical protein [Anaerolinea sp.]